MSAFLFQNPYKSELAAFLISLSLRVPSVLVHTRAMKKISEIRIKDHCHTHKSLNKRCPSGSRRSKNVSPSRISLEEAKDMRRVKRVRFADSDTVYQHNCKPNASSICSKGTQTQKIDDPKTSEYAFYKRLREGTERSFHFHNQDGQSKKVEASNCSEDLKVMAYDNSYHPELDQLVKYRCEEVRPLLPVKVTHTNLGSSLCLGEASKNQVTISSKHFDPQNSNLDLFSRKRWKLRQWLAEATSLEIDDISTNRYDVVSVLLQRLVPKSNASEIQMPPSSKYEELSIRSQLLASPDSDMNFKDLPCTRTPCLQLIQPTSGQHLDEDSSVCRSDKSRVFTSSQFDILGSDSLSTRKADMFDTQLDIVDSDSFSTRKADMFDTQWDIVDSDSFSTRKADSFSMRNADIFDLQYRKLQPYCASDDENAIVLHTKMEPCCFTDIDRDSFKRNGSLPQDQVPIPSKLGHVSQKSFASLWQSPKQSSGPSNNLSFPGVDEFHFNNFALGFEHLSQFLNQNDSDPCNSVLKVSPVREIVLRDDHEQSLRKSDAIGLDSSPLLAIHRSPCMTSLLDFWSERYPNHTSERALEENDYSVAVMKQLPSKLSCYQSYLSPGCRLLGKYKGSGVFNYPHSRHSFMSQVLSEKRCPNVDTFVLPSGLDPDFRWKNLLMNDSLGEHHSSICPKYKSHTRQTQNVSSSLLTEEQSKWSMGDSSQITMQSDFAEEIFNIQDLSSLNFRINLNRERPFPLLFDKSSCGYM